MHSNNRSPNWLDLPDLIWEQVLRDITAPLSERLVCRKVMVMADTSPHLALQLMYHQLPPPNPLDISQQELTLKEDWLQQLRNTDLERLLGKRRGSLTRLSISVEDSAGYHHRRPHTPDHIPDQALFLASQLAKLTSITTLSLCGSFGEEEGELPMENAIAALILTQFTALKNLVLLTEQSFYTLERFKSSFPHLAKLQQLYIRQSTIPDMMIFATFTNLTHLSVDNISSISPHGFMGMEKMTHLHIGQFGGEDISWIQYLKELLELNITIESVKSIDPISQLSKLRALDMNTTATDIGPIGLLQQLTTCQMCCSMAINMNAVSNLTALCHLTLYTFNRCPIVLPVNSASLQTLRVHAPPRLTPSALETISTAHNLRSLDLSMNRGLDSTNLLVLSTLTRLTALNLDGSDACSNTVRTLRDQLPGGRQQLRFLKVHTAPMDSYGVCDPDERDEIFPGGGVPKLFV